MLSDLAKMESLGLDQEWMTTEHSMGVREAQKAKTIFSIRKMPIVGVEANVTTRMV